MFVFRIVSREKMITKTQPEKQCAPGPGDAPGVPRKSNIGHEWGCHGSVRAHTLGKRSHAHGAPATSTEHQPRTNTCRVHGASNTSTEHQLRISTCRVHGAPATSTEHQPRISTCRAHGAPATTTEHRPCRNPDRGRGRPGPFGSGSGWGAAAGRWLGARARRRCLGRDMAWWGEGGLWRVLATALGEGLPGRTWKLPGCSCVWSVASKKITARKAATFVPGENISEIHFSETYVL